MFSFLYTRVGSRYWKSARRIKALTKGDYELLHGRDDPFDKEGSDDDFMTSHKSKHTLSLKKPVKKSTETGQLDVLEGRVSVVEDVIKDWRRHEDNKEELRRELADCKDSIKAMECELSAKRRKLADAKAFVDAIQENMCCLICKTISSGDCVVFPCCKQFGTCYSCIHEWLLESSSYPHCRAQMEIDCCIKLPDAVQLRAIFSTIQTFKQFNDDVIIEL